MSEKFTIEITDQDQLDGIQAAMEAYNENNPQNLQATTQDFFSLMITSQFAQWADAKINDELRGAVEAARGGDTTLLSSVVQRFDKKTQSAS